MPRRWSFNALYSVVVFSHDFQPIFLIIAPILSRFSPDFAPIKLLTSRRKFGGPKMISNTDVFYV